MTHPNNGQKPRQEFCEKCSKPIPVKGKVYTEYCHCTRLVTPQPDKPSAIVNVEKNNKLQQELEEARNSITYLNKENQEQHDAFTSELTAARAKYDELVSYMPKVPTQPYEKELAQELAVARSNLKAAEGEIEQWVASSQEQSKRYAAAKALLRECAEFVECVQPVLENRSAGFGGMALETFGAKLLQKLKEIK